MFFSSFFYFHNLRGRSQHAIRRAFRASCYFRSFLLLVLTNFSFGLLRASCSLRSFLLSKPPIGGKSFKFYQILQFLLSVSYCLILLFVLTCIYKMFDLCRFVRFLPRKGHSLRLLCRSQHTGRRALRSSCFLRSLLLSKPPIGGKLFKILFKMVQNVFLFLILPFAL